MGYIGGKYFTKLSKKITTSQWKKMEMAQTGQTCL